MKKSVIILIALIYIAAIALVSFFGLQALMLDPVVYVEKIEIINEGVRQNEKGEYGIKIPFVEGGTQYQIEHRVYPENATDKGVRYAVSDNKLSFVSIDENGLVTITERGSFTVIITPADGTPEVETHFIIIVS